MPNHRIIRRSWFIVPLSLWIGFNESLSAQTIVANISGTVYDDWNMNGFRDPAEPPLANVRVTLYIGSTYLLPTTDFAVTSPSGNFSFNRTYFVGGYGTFHVSVDVSINPGNEIYTGVLAAPQIVALSASYPSATIQGAESYGIAALERQWNQNALSTDWFDNSNWNRGAPTSRVKAVINQSSSTPEISSNARVMELRINAGGQLRLRSSVAFEVIGDLNNYGVLEIADSAAPIIQCGGAWNQNGTFLPGRSSVELSGTPLIARQGSRFYDLRIARDVASSGNLSVAGKLRLDGDLVLENMDTLHVANSDADALSGPGKVPRGTIKRQIRQLTSERFRFESNNTYIRFDSTGSSPPMVLMSTYPHMSPLAYGTNWIAVPSSIDTAANVVNAKGINQFSRWTIGIPRPHGPYVQRVYAVGADGGRYQAELSLRFEQTEIPPGVAKDSLRLLRLEGATEVEPDLMISKTPTLHQNFPNPFNPSTVITFELPCESHVSLKICNLLGQEVASLATDELMQPGIHTRKLSAQGLSSGAYIYQLTVRSSNGVSSSARKLLVIR